MICPNCKHRVDPVTSDIWLDTVTKEVVTPIEVIAAVYIWDQSAMHISGYSILPTELRDALWTQLHDHEKTKTTT